LVKNVISVFAGIAKSDNPYRITIKEDGKGIQKQFGTIDEYPKDKEPSIV